MKTTLHRYSFDTTISSEHKAYKALSERLQRSQGRLMRTYGDPDHRCDLDGEITIDTEHIFDNQWNTAATDEHIGRRVFDWYEEILRNESIRTGYYLDLTDEMREIRRNTYACGYCGKQEPAAKGYVFCDKCLDSPYLKPDDLYLLRMQSCEDLFKPRAPLTETERAHLMPLYVARQTTGADSRAVQKRERQRADVVARSRRKIANATTERDGMLWLWEHNLDLENVIYYDHTDRFCFGWRSPVSDEVASKILEVISEFPHDYEIKGTTRTWERVS